MSQENLGWSPKNELNELIEKPVEEKEEVATKEQIMERAYDKGYEEGKKDINFQFSPYLTNLTPEKLADIPYEEYEKNYMLGYKEGRKLYDKSKD